MTYSHAVFERGDDVCLVPTEDGNAHFVEDDPIVRRKLDLELPLRFKVPIGSSLYLWPEARARYLWLEDIDHAAGVALGGGAELNLVGTLWVRGYGLVEGLIKGHGPLAYTGGVSWLLKE